MRAGVRRRWRGGLRLVLGGTAAVAVGALFLAACGTGSPTASGSGSTTTSTTSATTSTTTSTSTSTPAASSASAAAQNLAATAAVKSALMAAFLAHNGLPADQIAGTAPNSVYYGLVPSTDTYWAIATFVPTSNASYNTEVAMQDEGCCGIFTMTAGGSWTYTGSYLGLPCPGQLPAAIVSLWHLAEGEADCPGTTTSTS